MSSLKFYFEGTEYTSTVGFSHFVTYACHLYTLTEQREFLADVRMSDFNTVYQVRAGPWMLIATRTGFFLKGVNFAIGLRFDAEADMMRDPLVLALGSVVPLRYRVPPLRRAMERFSGTFRELNSLDEITLGFSLDSLEEGEIPIIYEGRVVNRSIEVPYEIYLYAVMDIDEDDSSGKEGKEEKREEKEATDVNDDVRDSDVVEKNFDEVEVPIVVEACSEVEQYVQGAIDHLSGVLEMRDNCEGFDDRVVDYYTCIRVDRSMDTDGMFDHFESNCLFDYVYDTSDGTVQVIREKKDVVPYVFDIRRDFSSGGQQMCPSMSWEQFNRIPVPVKKKIVYRFLSFLIDHPGFIPMNGGKGMEGTHFQFDEYIDCGIVTFRDVEVLIHIDLAMLELFLGDNFLLYFDRILHRDWYGALRGLVMNSAYVHTMPNAICDYKYDYDLSLNGFETGFSDSQFVIGFSDDDALSFGIPGLCTDFPYKFRDGTSVITVVSYFEREMTYERLQAILMLAALTTVRVITTDFRRFQGIMKYCGTRYGKFSMRQGLFEYIRRYTNIFVG